MSYRIYIKGKLSAVARDTMSAVVRCNAYVDSHKLDDIESFYVDLSGNETAHDWRKDYRELCNGY